VFEMAISKEIVCEFNRAFKMELQMIFKNKKVSFIHALPFPMVEERIVKLVCALGIESHTINDLTADILIAMDSESFKKATGAGLVYEAAYLESSVLVVHRPMEP